MMNFANLPKEELLDLLLKYNQYIQDANDEDRYIDGWCPVCIAEFYESEYQMIPKLFPVACELCGEVLETPQDDYGDCVPGHEDAHLCGNCGRGIIDEMFGECCEEDDEDE